MISQFTIKNSYLLKIFKRITDADMFSANYFYPDSPAFITTQLPFTCITFAITSDHTTSLEYLCTTWPNRSFNSQGEQTDRGHPTRLQSMDNLLSVCRPPKPTVIHDRNADNGHGLYNRSTNTECLVII